jgi:hypothetical protein
MLFDSHWWRFLLQKHYFLGHFAFRSRINRRIATSLPDHIYIPYHSSDISSHRSTMMAALLFGYLAPQTIILKLFPFVMICLVDQSASQCQMLFTQKWSCQKSQLSGTSLCIMKNYDSSFFEEKSPFAEPCPSCHWTIAIPWLFHRKDVIHSLLFSFK